jgi:hypothetical protein
MLLYDVMLGDDRRLSAVMAENTRRTWADTGLPKNRAA